VIDGQTLGDGDLAIQEKGRVAAMEAGRRGLEWLRTVRCRRR